MTNKSDGVDRLYKAVENYVKRHNGSVVVIGGIQVQEWGDQKGNYYIAVKCTGRQPVFKDAKPAVLNAVETEKG